MFYEGVSRDRLARIARLFLETGQTPKEHRGGDRTKDRDKKITVDVINHIKKYKCKGSHYSRGKCVRTYLPPELNLVKMYQRYCEEQKAENKSICSISKFKKIFYTKFNMGFGSPHSDTCSTCKEFIIKIKLEHDLERRNQLRAQLRLHKLRAKKCFQISKQKNDNETDVFFDMQQNQPIPKLSIGEVFYLRQVWLYNLCIMENSRPINKTNICLYTWLETQSGKGANEVASALINYLTDLEKRLINEGNKELKVLRLFSDSCSAQNKNTILLSALYRFLEKSEVFYKILQIFPIRGHSYMPPDRVFGRIEKEYRKLETIEIPSQYYDVLEKYGNVKKWGEHWVTYDYKTVSKKLIKCKLPFSISQCRVLQYIKIGGKNVKVRVKNTYTGVSTEVELLKKGVKTMKLLDKVTKIPKTNHVSEEKRSDVRKIIKYVENSRDIFYEEFIGTNDENRAADGQV